MMGRKGQLFVEGSDDEHVIGHLLLRHDIHSILPPDRYPGIEQKQGVDQLLLAMKTAVRVAGEKPIGFVLDANDSLDRRWQQIRTLLREADVSAPDSPPAEGFIGASVKYQSRIGIWLMPDNRQCGSLEHFLEALVDVHDPLWVHAGSATTAAKAAGAKFKEQSSLKARIHTWLAWQEEPGLPYGSALKAEYFDSQGAVATAFVAWFRSLYAV